MDVITKGIPARLDDLQNGQPFAFEARTRTAIGIKVAYPQSQDSRVMILTPEAGQQPRLLGRQDVRPTIVYNQHKLAVVTGFLPGRLRNGVLNPQTGHIMQFNDNAYLGFLDEHDDPSSVSLKTGLIAGPIDGPAAVFDTWDIVYRGENGPELVFRYPPPS